MIYINYSHLIAHFIDTYWLRSKGSCQNLATSACINTYILSILYYRMYSRYNAKASTLPVIWGLSVQDRIITGRVTLKGFYNRWFYLKLSVV